MTGADLVVGIDDLPDAVIVLDETAVLRYANPAAESLFGWSAPDRIGSSALESVHPDDVEMALASLTTVFGKDVGTPLELRVMTATGWRLVELIGSSAAVDGRSMIVLTLRDLTARRRWEVGHDDEALFRTLLQHAAAVTILVSDAGLVRATSAALTRELGHDPEAVAGRPLAELVGPEDRSRLAQTIAAARSRRDGSRRGDLEVAMLHRDGTRVQYVLRITDLTDDPTVDGLVVSGHDISDLHATRQELAHSATHDDLTGLTNRSGLMRELAPLLRRPTAGTTAVALIDLDGFKPINDLFGHDAGDEILVTVAHRLRATVRDGDLVARLGGDEFVVVTTLPPDVDTQMLATRLEKSLTAPIHLSTGVSELGASIGVAVARPGDGVDTVLAEADAAMYAVKHRKRGTLDVRTRPIAERRALAEAIDPALADEQFEVHYLPIVDLESGRPVALEALVRWDHPTKGLLEPAEFLDVVEDTRRDVGLGACVARVAIRDIRVIREVTGLDLRVSINASVRQLLDPAFPSFLVDTLRREGVPPEALVVEVSERSMLDGATTGASTGIVTALHSLSGAGILVALDDFGTGYSSLTHVVSYPLDCLKIDRSFVAGLGSDTHRSSVVAALVGLAGATHMEVVAEGVEHPRQVETLRELGCRFGQGYHFSRPAPLEETIMACRLAAGVTSTSDDPPPASDDLTQRSD